jgi:alpha-galactosidase
MTTVTARGGRTAKIVILGAAGNAASVSSGAALLGDLFAMPIHLGQCEVWLQDADADALALIGQYAGRINQSLGEVFDVRVSRDLTEALPGADFVLLCDSAERFELRQQDWRLPLKHGVRHVLGDCAGPGGLSRTLRAVPRALELAREVERFAPGATLIVVGGPLSRVCMALSQHTRLRVVGVDLPARDCASLVARTLGLVKPSADPVRDARMMQRRVHIETSGLHRLGFVTAMHDRLRDENLYSRFRERFLSLPPDDALLSRRIVDVFGLLPSSDDRVLADFFAFGSETQLLSGPAHDSESQYRQADMRWSRIASVAAGELSPAYQVIAPSGLGAMWLIGALINGVDARGAALVLPNDGLIPQLPPDAAVERPVRIQQKRISGEALPADALPTGIAAILQREVDIQRLVLGAALDGDRRLALQALLLDPLIHSHAQATHLLEDMLDAQRASLPRFFA